MRELTKKEELILSVLYFIPNIYGRTYFQKLFFLIQNELFKSLDFGYTKYHYGPFSRELNNTINGLVQEGVIDEALSITRHNNLGHCYCLSKSFKKDVEKLISKIGKDKIEALQKFCKEYEHHTPSELLKHVYLNYPDWTINSLLTNH